MRLVPTYVRAYAHSIMHATSRARWKWFPEIASRPASSDPNLAISHQINDVISPSKLIVNLWPFRTISEFKNFRRGAHRCENVVARVQFHQVAGIKRAATQSEITNEFSRLYLLFTIFIFHFESLSFVIAVNSWGFPRAHVVRTI